MIQTTMPLHLQLRFPAHACARHLPATHSSCDKQHLRHIPSSFHLHNPRSNSSGCPLPPENNLHIVYISVGVPSRNQSNRQPKDTRPHKISRHPFSHHCRSLKTMITTKRQPIRDADCVSIGLVEEILYPFLSSPPLTLSSTHATQTIP